MEGKRMYKFDPDKIKDISDFGAVVWAIADQFRFTENYKHFDKIKDLLTEVHTENDEFHIPPNARFYKQTRIGKILEKLINKFGYKEIKRLDG